MHPRPTHFTSFDPREYQWSKLKQCVDKKQSILRRIPAKNQRIWVLLCKSVVVNLYHSQWLSSVGICNGKRVVGINYNEWVVGTVVKGWLVSKEWRVWWAKGWYRLLVRKSSLRDFSLLPRFLHPVSGELLWTRGEVMAHSKLDRGEIWHY